jgi:GTP-binding protein
MRNLYFQSTNTAQCLRAASTVLSLRSLSNSVRQISRPAAYFQRRHMSDVGKAAPWTPPPRPAPGQDGYVAKDKIRNVAIIAHVDHGKTTLVDGLLRQSEYGDRISSNDRVMDSNALEQERGITIMSKATRVDWNGYTLNIVDTPGHADFGGEVERVLSMVDGVILVIDATEGPMPQTKFVLNKALTHKLKPILVINKCDRTQARIFSGEVQNEAFDLFVQLGADDSQLEFPILYATARHGWATEQLDNVTKWMNLPEPPKRDVANLTPLYQAIVKHVPPPVVRSEGDFSMLVTSVEYDNYVGKVCTGRIYSGTAKPGDVLRPVTRAGVAGEPMKVMKVFCRRGTTREELDMATAGDIVSIAGINGMVGDTLTNTESITPLASPPLDAPTIAVTISPNTSPVNGKDGGKHLTAAQIRQRLLRETENNVAIQVFPSPHHADAMEVHGRGELQMGILLETMRREAYEVSVSPPQVLFKEENGKKYEPIEEVVMELSTDQSSIVMDKMKLRSATLMDFKELPNQKARLLYHCPSRTLMVL